MLIFVKQLLFSIFCFVLVRLNQNPAAQLLYTGKHFPVTKISGCVPHVCVLTTFISPNLSYRGFATKKSLITLQTENKFVTVFSTVVK